MDRLLQLEVFAKTAELGSLSKAAETLRMSNAAASRHLSALEARLAVRLIERKTRRQWLTEAGQELLQRCSTLLNELAEAEDAVTDRALSPKGTLRQLKDREPTSLSPCGISFAFSSSGTDSVPLRRGHLRKIHTAGRASPDARRST